MISDCRAKKQRARTTSASGLGPMNVLSSIKLFPVPPLICNPRAPATTHFTREAKQRRNQSMGYQSLRCERRWDLDLPHLRSERPLSGRPGPGSTAGSRSIETRGAGCMFVPPGIASRSCIVVQFGVMHRSSVCSPPPRLLPLDPSPRPPHAAPRPPLWLASLSPVRNLDGQCANGSGRYW